MADLNVFKETSVPASPLPDAWYLLKEGANPYFTMRIADAGGTLYPLSIDVLGTLLAGYSAGSNTAIASTDNVLQAFQKTQGQINNLAAAIAGGIKTPLPLDASANPNYPAAAKGDSYIITVAGKVGGASGKDVEVGDVVNALNANAGGTQAGVGADWYILQTNTGEASDTVMGIVRRATISEVDNGSDVNAYVAAGRLRSGVRATTLAGLSTGVNSAVVAGDTVLAGIGKLQAQVNNRVVSNSAITGATRTKITYDSKGLVTGGADLVESDIPTLSISKITNLQSSLGGKMPLEASANATSPIRNEANLNALPYSYAQLLTNITNGALSSVTSGTALSIFASSGGGLQMLAYHTEAHSSLADSFFYRMATAGSGVGSWFQIASREWVGAQNFLKGTGLARQVLYRNSSNEITGNTGMVYDDSIGTLSIGAGTAGNIDIKRDIQGIELNSGSLNTTSKYFTALKWTTTDPQLVTESPKLVALITAYAGQAYSDDSASAAGLAFFTSPATAGPTNVPLERWRMLPNGVLEAAGSQEIRTDTGDLKLTTRDANGNIVLTLHGTGALVYDASNGTGDFLTVDGSNKVRRRTAAQVRSDIGALGSGDLSGYVPTSRNISSGTGLTGGGNLSADRTIALSTASIASLALADTAVQPARSISAGTGLTGGGNLSADRTLALTGQALAFHNLGSNGFAARTSAGNVAARTITGSESIDVQNGNGVSGNPVIKMKYAATPAW